MAENSAGTQDMIRPDPNAVLALAFWLAWEGDTTMLERLKAETLARPSEEGTALPLGTIPMPRNADEAAAMHLIGESWLRANTSERLKALTAEDPRP